ncbi:uncharacterized protein PFL1_00645 [Pseudozyma flocculosa PF-1]|uniref:C2H2-type domain-containing protein n=1 Tax=Pseudozyma flocculosa TaxID=84751 RepID=A0A5C3EQB9_9BASI|nr:uncharacterized protein PFL1_00645 [Pseudozyma flocculosa PF-1]EPQ32449.1 hypothetical protein PFL1_00645 [Pseudozyma flocculosa PF-1]SPO34564.1 uncharacterized protein PSFLO_00035 [Pseudozyma flocculosa]
MTAAPSPPLPTRASLLELIQAAQQHLASSRPPSPRSPDKAKVIDPSYQHLHQLLTPPILPPIIDNGKGLSQGSRHPLHLSDELGSTFAEQQHVWADWVCCDMDHATASSCDDCQTLTCASSLANGSTCDSKGCPSASHVSTAMACCDSTDCDTSSAEVCDGIHSSATACFDSTCTGSPVCALPVATCCDLPDCSDGKSQACSTAAVECCDEPHCPELKDGSPAPHAVDCPDCNLPFGAQGRGPGTMYGSFQELLDCCCCRSSLTESEDRPQDASARQRLVEDVAAHGTSAHDLCTTHEPCVPPPSTAYLSGGPSHHHQQADASSCQPRQLSQPPTPSYVSLSGSQRTSVGHTPAYSPSVTDSTIDTPTYGANRQHTHQKTPSAGPAGQHDGLQLQNFRSSSLSSASHDDWHNGFAAIQPAAGSGSSVSSACHFTQPHGHAFNGGCLPPTWTSGGPNSQEASDFHARWYPEPDSQNLAPIALDDQAKAAPARSAPPQEDARLQRCQWAGCKDRFWTVEELVAHVNHAHLAKKQVDPAPSASATSAPIRSAHGWPDFSIAAHGGHGVDSALAMPPSSAAAAMPCMWSDCRSTSGPEQDVQLDDVIAMLKEAGMDWPSDTDAINDKATAAMLQHLWTAHLGHATQGSQPGLLENAAPMAAVRSGKRRRQGPAELDLARPATLGRADKRARSSAPPDEGEDRCCDNVRIGADGKSGHVCGWEGCSEVFADHQGLTEHITNVHVGSGKAVYECRWVGCERFHKGRQFSQKQKVLRHIQTHTGDRPFKCELCGRRFSEANTLAQHVRTHTQEKPFVCDHPGCGKAFSVSGSLTIHKRTHSGAKPFVCKHPGCDKAFAESSNLTKHMRLHSGEKPFKCDECGKRFSRPDQASRHQKTHQRKRDRLRAKMSGGEAQGSVAEEAEEDDAGDE